MGTLFIITGISHFVNPAMFLKMMPRPFPFPLAMVYLSGMLEVGLGLFLFSKKFRPTAAWGVIALLIAVFPANIFMATHASEWNIPQWILYLRLPLQFVLLYWAFQYTKKPD